MGPVGMLASIVRGREQIRSPSVPIGHRDTPPLIGTPTTSPIGKRSICRARASAIVI